LLVVDRRLFAKAHLQQVQTSIAPRARKSLNLPVLPPVAVAAADHYCLQLSKGTRKLAPGPKVAS
jgi:hypothetical protein